MGTTLQVEPLHLLKLLRMGIKNGAMESVIAILDSAIEQMEDREKQCEDEPAS